MDKLQEIKQAFIESHDNLPSGMTNLDDKEIWWMIQIIEQQQEQNKLLNEQLDISHSLRDRDFKELERYRKATQESLRRLKEGGSGSRTFVKETLEEALLGEFYE